mgnify:CR=1 FL=1
MYLAFLGLRELPFSITPDTQFFYPCSSTQNALNTLLVAVRSGEGFVKITGEVGTGKSLLCRTLMNRLADDFCVAYVPNPLVDASSLLQDIARELSLEVDADASAAQCLRLLNAHLMNLHLQGQRVMVCLDEAQAMSIETLEALRLLTNLETEKRKLLQVVIFGQPELDRKLDRPEIRQLKQRIVFHYRLSPMRADEVGQYVAHRLSVAGYKGAPLFSKMALWLLTRETGGVPRLVNILAHKALMSAYGKGHRAVDVWDVRAAVKDTELSGAADPVRRALGSVPGLLWISGLVAVGWWMARSLAP